MNVAICAEANANRGQMTAIAEAIGDDSSVVLEPVEAAGAWPESFAQNLIAAEGFLEDRDPDVVVAAGAGPFALAVALAATRAGVALVRISSQVSPDNREIARDALLADHLATLLICFSESDREALGADTLTQAAIYCETPDQAGAAILTLLRTPSAATASL